MEPRNGWLKAGSAWILLLGLQTSLFAQTAPEAPASNLNPRSVTTGSFLPKPAPGETAVCGIHYYGPCLPDQSQGSPATTDAAKDAPKPMTAPGTDLYTTTAFDDYGFSGDDPLIKTLIKSEVSENGPGKVVTASKSIVTVKTDHDAVASTKPRLKERASEYDDVELDPSILHPSTRLDPVLTVPSSEPESRMLAKVIAPKSALGQLNWMSIKTPAGPLLARDEEVHSYMNGLWDAQSPQDWQDLEKHAREHNYIRRTKN